jgi:hypothetical protein
MAGRSASQEPTVHDKGEDMTRTTVRGVQVATVLTAVVLAAFSLAASVQAAGVVGTGTATSCTDDALHTALMGGGLVTFNCGSAPVTIDLTNLPGANGTETIAADTTIDGGGNITVQQRGSGDVFDVNSGVHLIVRNLTVSGGHYGISVNGEVTATNCTFSDSGVGLLSNGTVTATDCTFYNLFQDGMLGSGMTATNCTFSHNANAVFTNGFSATQLHVLR